MSKKEVNKPVFNVYPQTGFQMRRDIAIDDILRQLIPGNIDEAFWSAVWEYSVRNQDEVTEALRDNVSVHTDENAYWMRVPDEYHGMYFRIRKDTVGKYWLDMAINTHLYPPNIRSIGVCNVPALSETNLKNPKNMVSIAEFQVLPCSSRNNSVPEGGESMGACILGDLIIDFGNTGITAGFIHDAHMELLPLDNPWDPYDYLNLRDNDSQKQIFHSNQLLFRLDTGVEPAMQNTGSMDLSNSSDTNAFLNKLWWISGERACEMAKNVPVDKTYLFSPKKFIRQWKDDEEKQPTINLRGMNKSRYETFKSADIVKETLRSLIKMIVASFVNPHFIHSDPTRRPLINRILLTYPLTWRSQDKDFFKTMVKEIAQETIPIHLDKGFDVEMSYYNEPYCVMGYLVSEIIHQFGGKNGSWEMIRSVMGNFNKPDDDSRVLIVDIGGGSSDIALVDVGLSSDFNNQNSCRLDLKATMRFNRAGDRISHIISTALWEHIRVARNIPFALSLTDKNGTIIDDQFRSILRKLQLDVMQLSENVKRTLAKGSVWYWQYPDEDKILNERDRAKLELNRDLIASIRFKNKYIKNINVLLDIACGNAHNKEAQEYLSNFSISNENISSCIEKDRKGLYEVFISLKQLVLSLKENNESLPDRVILSGRTAKLPCIKLLLERIFDRYMPSYRITSLEEFLPEEIRVDKSKNIEKLAVLLGVNAFRTRGLLTEINIDPNRIHRFVGPVVRDAERGCHLSLNNRPGWYADDFVRPGAQKLSPSSYLSLHVRPNTTVEIGQSYSEDGFAEVLGALTVNGTNKTSNDYVQVAVRVVDDSTLEVKDKNVVYSDIIPGVSDSRGPVDHFCHDGIMDFDGSIKEICNQVFDLLKSRHK